MAVHHFSLMHLWLLIIILALSTFVAATSLTLEQRLEKLEKDHVSTRLFLLFNESLIVLIHLSIFQRII